MSGTSVLSPGIASWILFLGEQMWDDLRLMAGKAPPASSRPPEEIPGSIT